MINWSDKFRGVLLGQAVGDAIGLPREGLSARRGQRMFGDPPLHHRLIFGRGMISDDTEHVCMTAQALLASGGKTDAFARSLAWRMRGWLLGVPAGVGLATLRSILKLWVGFGPNSSGVNSAGNGPAMRAPILGVWAAATEATPETLAQLVRASTRLTHTDDRAYEGALVIALAASYGATSGDAGLCPKKIIESLSSCIQGKELRESLEKVAAHLARNAATEELADSLGLARAVTGYINHTVPIALYCWLRWPNDFRRAVEDAVLCGGDTDTTAAVVGGIAGATNGFDGIPAEWLAGLRDWPRSTSWIGSLGQRLGDHATDRSIDRASRPLLLAWPGLLLRNPLFVAIILWHGFRRLFPPY